MFKMIHFFINEGDLLDEKVDWHIFNVFYALFMDMFILLLCAGICHWPTYTNRY